MPLGLKKLDYVWVHISVIYGTLIIESLLLLGLLTRRFRHWAIILGMAFHAFLAISGYAFYAPFSMLTVALHTLFIAEDSAARILASQQWQRVQYILSGWKGVALLLTSALSLYFLAQIGAYAEAGLLWLMLISPLVWAVARGNASDAKMPLRSTNWGVNVISILFVFNGLTPYLGLKTAQSINMFANLHLEGGRSNHLILRSPPGPFKYLEDLVTIQDAGGHPILSYAQKHELKVVRYQLLNWLKRDQSLEVSFTDVDGQLWERQSAATMDSEIQELLHAGFFRKWFHFNLVETRQPKPCALDR